MQSVSNLTLISAHPTWKVSSTEPERTHLMYEYSVYVRLYLRYIYIYIQDSIEDWPNLAWRRHLISVSLEVAKYSVLPDGFSFTPIKHDTLKPLVEETVGPLCRWLNAHFTLPQVHLAPLRNCPLFKWRRNFVAMQVEPEKQIYIHSLLAIPPWLFPIG